MTVSPIYLRHRLIRPVRSIPVVWPEGAIQVDPALDRLHLVAGEFDVVMSGVEHLPQAALERAETLRLGLGRSHGVPVVKMMHPAAGDQGTVRGGYAFSIQCPGKIDPISLI